MLWSSCNSSNYQPSYLLHFLRLHLRYPSLIHRSREAMKLGTGRIFYIHIYLLTLIFLSCLRQIKCATTGDSQCDGSGFVCISITLRDNQPAEVKVTAMQLVVGWVGVGFGASLMDLADLAAHWQNSDGSLTVSRRQPANHVMPSPLSQTDQNLFTQLLLQGVSNITTSTPLVWHYLRPANIDGASDLTATLTPMVWAFSKVKPSSNSQSANLPAHVNQGTFNLDLSKAVADSPLPSLPSTTSASASATVGAPGTGSASLSGSVSQTGTGTPTSIVSNDQTGSQSLSSYDIMVISHGAIMFTAMGVLVPAAIFIARYKRSSHSWVRTHYIIQTVVLLMIIGGGYIGYRQSSPVHLKTPHQIIGVTIIGAVVVQLFLGYIIHAMFEPHRTYRPLRNKIHKLFGRCIMALSIAQIPLGLIDYQPNQKTFFIIYWFWIGVLVVTFFFFEVSRRGEKKIAKVEAGWRNDENKYQELHELNTH